VDSEGNTYKKHAVEEWLQRNATSPLTRNRLTAAMLQPNRALGTAIQEFFQHAAIHSPPDARKGTHNPWVKPGRTVIRLNGE
jgi:hypothetical protein